MAQGSKGQGRSLKRMSGGAEESAKGKMKSGADSGMEEGQRRSQRVGPGGRTPQPSLPRKLTPSLPHPGLLQAKLTYKHLLPLQNALLRQLSCRAARVDGIVQEAGAWAGTLGQCPGWRRRLGHSPAHGHHFIGCVWLRGLFLWQLKVPTWPPTHWHLWLILDRRQEGLWSWGL